MGFRHVLKRSDARYPALNPLILLTHASPHFLQHAGFFHIGISVWTLLLFGPQVEAAYGTTSFVVLYFLTGAFGNLMSFAQTQDATIGGTVSARLRP